MRKAKRSEFARLIHQLLVIEKQRPVARIAQALGMSYPTFYARVCGRVPFRPEEITALLREIPDARLVDLLLSGTHFIGVRRPERRRNLRPNRIWNDAVHTICEAAELLRELESALDDKMIDAVQRCRIEAHINEAERALEAIRTAVLLRCENTAQEQPHAVEAG